MKQRGQPRAGGTEKQRKRSPRGMGAAVFGIGQGYNGNSATAQSGTDLLENINIPGSQTYQTGDVITEAIVDCQSTRRLADLSATFQRVHWSRLRFTIEGAFPSTSGGGFIAAFVRDPTDTLPEHPLDRLKWAMGRSCVVDCKWYDCGTINVPPHPDLQYTSQGANSDVRWWSPGKLVLVAKGGPATPGSLTIKMDWSVTFSMPSSERVDTVEPPIGLPADVTVPFNIVGAHATLMVSSGGPDPHDETYSVPDWTHLEPLTNGDTLFFPSPIYLSGEYNTANDYVPVRCHKAIWNTTATNMTSKSAQLIRPNFVLCCDDNPLNQGLTGGSTWHLLTGGIGVCLPRDEILRVQRVDEISVPAHLSVFRPRGIEEMRVPGFKTTHMAVGPSGQDLRATERVVKSSPADWPTVNAAVTGEA